MDNNYRVGIHIDLTTDEITTFDLTTIVPIPKSIRINGLGNIVFIFDEEE